MSSNPIRVLLHNNWILSPKGGCRTQFVVFCWWGGGQHTSHCFKPGPAIVAKMRREVHSELAEEFTHPREAEEELDLMRVSVKHSQGHGRAECQLLYIFPAVWSTICRCLPCASIVREECALCGLPTEASSAAKIRNHIEELRHQS